MMSQDEIDLIKYVLEPRVAKLCESRTLLRSLLVRALDVNTIVDATVDAMVLSIEAHILELDVDKVHLSVTASVDVPADWWEHVKERFAPAWVLDRWPVRRAIVKQTAHRTANFKVAFAGLNLRLPPGVTVHRMVAESPVDYRGRRPRPSSATIARK